MLILTHHCYSIKNVNMIILIYIIYILIKEYYSTNDECQYYIGSIIYTLKRLLIYILNMMNVTRSYSIYLSMSVIV